MLKRSISLPAVVLIAVAALVLGSFGTATAGALTTKTVRKIAAKVVDKKASGLSVASAKSADTAKSADSAKSADAVKDSAITSASVKDGTLTSADLAAGTVPVVMWAVVNASPGTLKRGSHVVSVTKTSTGNYTILFDRSAATCAYAATPTLSTDASIFISGQTGNTVFVSVKNAAATAAADIDFSLIVTC
jgi:hypothetical protein